MDKSQIITLYNRDQRKEVEYPDMRRELTPNVVRHIDTSNFRKGLISYSQLNEANVENTIREQVSYFEGIRQNFEWKLYDYDQPSDLKGRLRSNRFIVEEPEAIMVLDLKDASEIVRKPVFHKVRRIIDPEKLVDVQSVEQEVWGEDSSWVVHFLGDTLR